MVTWCCVPKMLKWNYPNIQSISIYNLISYKYSLSQIKKKFLHKHKKCNMNGISTTGVEKERTFYNWVKSYLRQGQFNNIDSL